MGGGVGVRREKERKKGERDKTKGARERRGGKTREGERGGRTAARHSRIFLKYKI